MPEAEEFGSLCQTVYTKVRSSNYRVAYEEIQQLYAKRLDSYAQRIQRDMEAGVTLESLTKQPKQKQTPKPPRKRKKKKREPAATESWQDDRFFFIAGYTSGGAPYGVTWEEMGLEPCEELS